MSCIVDLQAIDGDRNIARAYAIEFGQDLFGAWVLRRYWVFPVSTYGTEMGL
jgi:hypothetical protein